MISPDPLRLKCVQKRVNEWKESHSEWRATGTMPNRAEEDAEVWSKDNRKPEIQSLVRARANFAHCSHFMSTYECLFSIESFLSSVTHSFLLVFFSSPRVHIHLVGCRMSMSLHEFYFCMWIVSENWLWLDGQTNGWIRETKVSIVRSFVPRATHSWAWCRTFQLPCTSVCSLPKTTAKVNNNSNLAYIENVRDSKKEFFFF